jgi:hypothetical protein
MLWFLRSRYIKYAIFLKIYVRQRPRIEIRKASGVYLMFGISTNSCFQYSFSGAEKDILIVNNILIFHRKLLRQLKEKSML